MDEHAAIALLKRGNIDGLETLVRMYQTRAVRAAYLVTRDLASAEDVVQTAFVRAYERIDQFDQQRSFGPWFLRIVVNDAVKLMQRRKRNMSLDDHVTAEELVAELLASTQPGPDYLVEQAEIQNAVWTALGQLTADQRAVIVRRYYLHMSEPDIADDLDRPLSTIKWRLHSARRRLQTLLRALRPGSEVDETNHEAQRITAKYEHYNERATYCV